MEEHFSKPKSFGAVLDQTFRISKNNFSNFFIIMLVIVGPIILLEALISLLAGNSFFRDMAAGSNLLEQINNTIDETIYGTTSIGEDVGLLLVGFVSIAFYPIAMAAVIHAIDAIRKQEEYTAGSVIKQAFSRFWPIFGSSLLFAVIVFGMLFAMIFIVSIVTAIGALIHPGMGIMIFVVLFLAALSVFAFLLTRWGLYLPAVVFEPCAPGLGRSWNLTRRNFWRTLGLFVVIGLIYMIINLVFDVLFTAILGYSVLYSVLINIISLITTMFFTVGYSVIYFDLKLRNDGDDLAEMIENYDTQNASNP